MTALHALPGRLRRIPDGETGDLQQFTAWQHKSFPAAIIQPRWGGGPPPDPNTVKYSLSDVKTTRYDDRSIASYATFCVLRASRTVPPGVHFQVSLPTPMTMIRGLLVTEYCLIIEPLYEERFLRSLRHIQDSIPASDLSIQ